MIRAANVSLPSPLWGEGLGVRGERSLGSGSPRPFGESGGGVVAKKGPLWITPHPRPLSPKGGEGRNARLRRDVLSVRLNPPAFLGETLDRVLTLVARQFVDVPNQSGLSGS